MSPRALLLAAVLAAACLAHAEIRTEPERQPGSPAAEAKAYRAPPARVAATRLSPFAAPKAQVELPGTPTQIGHARVVDALDAPVSAGRALAWEPAGDGGLRAAFSVTSPGAAATRLGLRIAAAPAGTTLRFYPPSGEAPYEVAFAQIEAQLRMGSTAGQADEVYWSPVVEGDTQVVEIELAPGESARGLDISVPSLSHLVTSAKDEFVMPKATAATCNIDSSCHHTSWGTESAAVARMVFTSGGSSYLCTGTMLADRDTTTTIPYFLSANHCISTQSAATTLQTYWFYRSTTCDSGVRGSYSTRVGGAQLLYASASTDTSFMRLNATPPPGVGYAGWIVSGSSASIGSAVTGIHNPRGDLQKISFGSLRSYATCAAADDGFTCRGASAPASTFYSVTWRSGITESGSSGSAVFLDSGRYLLGTLYGGSGGCGETSTDYYGRFDVAYNAALSQWLGNAPASTPVAAPSFDYTDLWWNSAESGWGLSLTQHGTSLFGAWYVYDDRGNPVWVVMPGGSWTADDTFVGDLYATTGPDPTGAFDPSRVTTSRVGSATLRFSARDRGTLTYTAYGTGGTKNISRQAFGAVDSTPIATYADLWWTPSESGWGLAISQQYRTLFAVWYSYRADGSPVWYVMPGGSWTASDTYAGTLYRTSYGAGGFFGTGFNAQAVTPVEVGRITLRFNGTSAATMTYTVNGVTGTKALTRQVF